MTNRDILQRAVWLAFDASHPVGMGILHVATAMKQTEETILDNCSVAEKPDGSLVCYTDYVCGRMMKTQFLVTKDGNLTLGTSEPRPDYQSWCGQYRNNKGLIEATMKSFEQQPTN